MQTYYAITKKNTSFNCTGVTGVTNHHDHSFPNIFIFCHWMHWSNSPHLVNSIAMMIAQVAHWPLGNIDGYPTHRWQWEICKLPKLLDAYPHGNWNSCSSFMVMLKRYATPFHNPHLYIQHPVCPSFLWTKLCCFHLVQRCTCWGGWLNHHSYPPMSPTNVMCLSWIYHCHPTPPNH
jgi:hypothetical protein